MHLEHHGILGQKWGVRRFQNADGSYTAAGKKRYGNLSTAKQIQRRLNDLDQAQAYIARDRGHNALRAEGLAARMKKNPNKASKYANKLTKAQNNVKYYQKQSNKGYKETKALLKRAKSLNMTVEEIKSSRSYARGSDYLMAALGGAALGGISAATGNPFIARAIPAMSFAAATSSMTPGTYFKVRNKK